MADFIGIPAGRGKPVRNPVGVYAVPNMGWYALRRLERRGPFQMREQADAEYIKMCEISPGAESWLAIARMVASGLLFMSILMVVVFMLLWGAVWMAL